MPRLRHLRCCDRVGREVCPFFLERGSAFRKGQAHWTNVGMEFQVSLPETRNRAAESALRWERSRGNRELRLFHPECPGGIRLASNIHVEWGFEQRWKNLTPELLPSS